jgi:hypothetical protein
MASRYVPGVEKLQSVDTGTVVITDQRVVCIGQAQTRKSQFTKLVNYQHHPDGRYTTISVSNRQRPSCISHGHVESWCFRLDLADAQFPGEVDRFVAQLKGKLTDHERRRPTEPASTRP